MFSAHPRVPAWGQASISLFKSYFFSGQIPRRRLYFALLIVALSLSTVYLLWHRYTVAMSRTEAPSLLTQIPPPPIHRPVRPNLPKVLRAHAIKESFRHAYYAYENYAMPADELRPLSRGQQRNFNGWGVTAYDALDTLYLMGLDQEFERALTHIEKGIFHQEATEHAPFFETVIRYLGSLLSSYAISGRPSLLEKADELASKLMPAFSPNTGLPAYSVNTETGSTQGPEGSNTILAEMASFQMEYKYLAHVTGKSEYLSAAERVTDWLRRGQLDNGMWYTSWNIRTGEQTDKHLTVGAWADSAYEYLLKQYVMSNKTETSLRDMYLNSTAGVLSNLLYLSPKRHILYVTDTTSGGPSRWFEHLSCFYPGLLALGAHVLKGEIDEGERELHLWAAEGLAYSCWLMYADQEIGLGPEIALMNSPADSDSTLWMDAVETWKELGRPLGKPPGVGLLAEPMPDTDDMTEKDYGVKDGRYLLRPETIESLYVLWRTTGDEVWRERCWAIFVAIDTFCRMPVGYASIDSVSAGPGKAPRNLDEMPSYSLAETWKYLYLMFLDHDPLPMDKFVFNTEAHPLPIFHWTDPEMRKYGFGSTGNHSIVKPLDS